MSAGKDAYEDRRARENVERERWEKNQADKIAQERIHSELVGNINNLLAGRLCLVREQINDHTTVWKVSAP